jgi:hypothetical protein
MFAVPAEAPSVAAAGCEPDEILVNPCRPWVGAASNNYVSGFRNSIEHHEARAGRQMDIVHNYRRPGEVLTNEDRSMAGRPGTIGFFNWKPASNWSAAGGGNSSVNAQIDNMAESIKLLGDTKIFLTVAHEPENDVERGGDPACPTTQYSGREGTSAEYVQMWHNVRARFDALGVYNVVWVMNYLGYVKWDCLIAGLWPGNDYVDWVMFDPYPRISTYEQVTGRFYDYLTSISDAEHDFLSKPWGLAEYGSVASSQSAAYRLYDDILRTAKAGVFPKLRAYINWDGYGASDVRVQRTRSGAIDQTEQDHYNALVNDPFFTDPDVPDVPDLEFPTIEVTSPADGATVTGDTTVSGPTSDNIGVTTCELIVDDTTIDDAPPLGNTCSLSWQSATATDGPHTLALAATDAAGNRTISTTIDITVDNAPDLDPPEVPTALTATVGTTGSGAPRVALTWDADLSDVETFTVIRDGSPLTTVGQVLNWNDDGVAAGQTYVYAVIATDASGNPSAASDPATASIPVPSGPDNTDPSRPQNLTATARPGAIELEWEASTDNVAVQWYYLFRANRKYVRLPASQTSYVDTNVNGGQRYVYKVYAIDTSGNWGGRSNHASATAI